MSMVKAAISQACPGKNMHIEQLDLIAPIQHYVTVAPINLALLSLEVKIKAGIEGVFLVLCKVLHPTVHEQLWRED